jgi:hypothetical protein
LLVEVVVVRRPQRLEFSARRTSDSWQLGSTQEFRIPDKALRTQM